MAQYWYARRPKSAEHQHPFLVFDAHDRLHIPLTAFAKEACARLGPKTPQTYLYALMPYFTWLGTDLWQVRMGHRWDAPPQQVRRSLDDYLIQKLQCQLLPQKQGWRYVAITAGTRSTLRIFLAALKLFYQVMREQGKYSFANPLVDSMSATIAAALAHLEQEEQGRNPLEESNPALGSGTQQVFNWTALEWTPARGVFVAWIGQELLRLRADKAALQAQVATLEAQLNK